MPVVTVTRCHVMHWEGKAKAFPSLDLNGKLIIHGCKLVEGDHGLFLAMPQEKSQKDNKWYDQVQVIDRDLKTAMQTVAIDHYERQIGVGATAKPAGADAPF